MARRSRAQFQFTFVELSVLAVSFAVSAGLVFLLGFYVGRQVAAEHAPIGDNVARVPVGEAPHDAAPAEARPPSPAAAPSAPPAAPPVTPPPASPAVDQPRRPLPPTAAVEEAPAEPAAAPGPSVPFTVQVLATRNQVEAETLAANLKKKGYGAFVAAIEDAGGSWYRVRIGRYDDADSARRMAERCHRELGLTQAYVSPIAANSR